MNFYREVPFTKTMAVHSDAETFFFFFSLFPFSSHSFLHEGMRAKLTRKKSIIEFSNDAGEAELEKMRELFNIADLNQDGTISRDELRSVMELLGMQVSEQGFDSFFKALDVDHTGVINFKEFQNGFKTLTKKKPSVAGAPSSGAQIGGFALELRKNPGAFFDAVDSDKDGSISKNELKSLLTHQAKWSFQAQEFDALWDLMDENHDGKISRAEFESSIHWISVHASYEPGHAGEMSTEMLLLDFSRTLVKNTLEKAESAVAKKSFKTAHSIIAILDLTQLDFLTSQLEHPIISEAQRTRIDEIRSMN